MTTLRRGWRRGGYGYGGSVRRQLNRPKAVDCGDVGRPGRARGRRGRGQRGVYRCFWRCRSGLWVMYEWYRRICMASGWCSSRGSSRAYGQHWHWHYCFSLFPTREAPFALRFRYATLTLDPGGWPCEPCLGWVALFAASVWLLPRAPRPHAQSYRRQANQSIPSC